MDAIRNPTGRFPMLGVPVEQKPCGWATRLADGKGFSGVPIMAQQLTVDTRHEGDVTILALAGEIDLESAPTLRNAVTEVTDAGADRIVLDLSDVSFIDSTGLGVFIYAQKKLRLRQGTLDIVGSTRRILAIFKLAGLDKAFRIHPSLEAALGQEDPAAPA
jgi:anti-sigma B factor antagonist